MKSVIFTNWTSEDFTWTWNSVPYTFPAGKTIYLEDYLADHFAKHLVDRELFRQAKQTTDHSRASLIAKCIKGNDEAEEQVPEKVAMEVLNKNAKTAPRFCENCDSKGNRHKKGCPSSVKVDESFEGLN